LSSRTQTPPALRLVVQKRACGKREVMGTGLVVANLEVVQSRLPMRLAYGGSMGRVTQIPVRRHFITDVAQKLAADFTQKALFDPAIA
jgi:hypothetical protein